MTETVDLTLLTLQMSVHFASEWAPSHSYSWLCPQKNSGGETVVNSLLFYNSLLYNSLLAVAYIATEDFICRQIAGCRIGVSDHR